MNLSEELVWRGFLNQTTYKDIKSIDNKKIVFYHGYDVSSDSQTIGNLAAMMLDRCLLRHGHKAIIVAGGATSLVGDPGGKDDERELQSLETIAHNTKCAEEQIKRVFSGYDFTLVNNLGWTHKMGVLDYLRDYGKHFSMTPLIQRDYIARRIGEKGSGISYAEFSYTILQGIDYLHLFDEYNCTLQLGGSDQWGNCLSGVDLIRRVRGAEVDALSSPLIINKSTGKKFGKSEEGAIWLDPLKTSPLDFYQFWINSDDLGVISYIKIFTELSKTEIEKLEVDQKANPASRVAQKALAHEVTKIVHGANVTMHVEVATEVLTGKSSITEVNKDALVGLKDYLKFLVIDKNKTITATLVTSGLATSNTEARRLIEDGSIYIDNVKVTVDQIDFSDFKHELSMLRRGKAFKDTVFVEMKK